MHWPTARPSTKRKRADDPPSSPSSQASSASASQTQVAAQPSQLLALQASSSQLGWSPGRSGVYLDERTVNGWGNCHRCGEPGHFVKDCPLTNKPWKARRPDNCYKCDGPILVGEECNYDREQSRACHTRCVMGQALVDRRKQAEAAEARSSKQRRVDFDPAADDASGASGASGASDPGREARAKISACVDNTEESIGVNACAGSGKTWLICQQVKRAQERNERIVAVTLNRDARDELESRGVKGARTWHSIGLAAWRAEHQSAKLKTEEEDVDGDDGDDDAEKRGKHGDAEEDATLASKNRLLLRVLYPKTSEEGGRATVSLEVRCLRTKGQSHPAQPAP